MIKKFARHFSYVNGDLCVPDRESVQGSTAILSRPRHVNETKPTPYAISATACYRSVFDDDRMIQMLKLKSLVPIKSPPRRCPGPEQDRSEFLYNFISDDGFEANAKRTRA